MLAGNEPGSSTGNLASSNCRYFMPGGQGEITGRHPVFFLAGGPWRRLSAKEAMGGFRMVNGNQETPGSVVNDL
jgi:hypothetical protein